MKKLKDIIDCNYDTTINDIKTNSKDIKPGDLFVCTMGFSVDRHDYIDDAIKNGAVAAVVSKNVNVNIPTVMVNNTNKVLVDITNKLYDYPAEKMNIIGVTGTDGKTTTSSVCYQLLSHFDSTGYIGTIGVKSKNYFGDPGVVMNTTNAIETTIRYLHNFHEKSSCKNACLEASSEGLYQGRLDGINFDIGIFTNLHSEHMNYHKNMENYFKAKSLLMKKVKKNGYCILNTDDEYYEKLKPICNGNVITYGSNEEADFYFYDIKLNEDSTSYKLKYKNNIYEINSSLVALFNVYNLTAAIAAGVMLGYDINELIKHTNSLFIDGRMEKIDEGQNFKIFVDFAHTPNALQEVYKYVNKLSYNKCITVIGSAGGRDFQKRPVMGKIVVENSDYTVFTMDDPRDEDPSVIIDDMTKDVMELNHKFEKVIDRRNAIERAISLAEKDDIILLLGKGAETCQKVKGETQEFSDLTVSREILKEFMKKAS